MKIFWRVPSIAAASLATSLVLSGVAAAEIEIEHDALKKVNSGVRVGLESTISEKDGAGSIRDARAYFKTKPANRYYFVPLSSGGGSDYSGVLPAMAAGTESFEYFILARDSNDQIVKTETWTVKIKDDKKALARMEQRPPREVKIDVDQVQEAQDMVDDARKVDDADRAKVAREEGEPDPDRRVDVRTETLDAPVQLAGVDDYINLQFVGPADVIGPAAVEKAAVVGSSSGGVGGAVLGGLVGATAIGAVAAGGGGGGGGSGGGSASSASGGAAACNTQQVAGGDAAESRVIELGRTSGSFVFQYDTFSQQDRMIVTYQGGVLFDTGCVGASGAPTLNYAGSSTQVRVTVQPNCAGGTGTAWNFTVNCP